MRQGIFFGTKKHEKMLSLIQTKTLSDNITR